MGLGLLFGSTPPHQPTHWLILSTNSPSYHVYSKMPSLLDLCHEILHDVFVQVQPADLAALSKTCAAFSSYINGNRLLWKDVYLKHFVSSSSSRGTGCILDWRISFILILETVRPTSLATDANRFLGYSYSNQNRSCLSFSSTSNPFDHHFMN
jgi:hypothetical protein